MNIAPHTELRIDSNIAVITKSIKFPSDEAAVELQWDHLNEIKYNVPFIDFLKQEYFDALPEVKQMADAGFYKSVSVFVAVQQLNKYVYDNFQYIKGITSVETTLDEVWKLKPGFARILLIFYW